MSQSTVSGILKENFVFKVGSDCSVSSAGTFDTFRQWTRPALLIPLQVIGGFREKLQIVTSCLVLF